MWDSAWLINPLSRLFEYKAIRTVVILTSGDLWNPPSYSSIISWFISCFIPPNLLRYMMFHDISLYIYIYTPIIYNSTKIYDISIVDMLHNIHL